jgi:hypothetical protein
MTLYCYAAGMLVGEWALAWNAASFNAVVFVKAPLGLVEWRPRLWLSLVALAAVVGAVAVLVIGVLLHMGALVRMLALPNIRWNHVDVERLRVSTAHLDCIPPHPPPRTRSRCPPPPLPPG